MKAITAMICVTVAALAFDNPALLWWYVVPLLMAWDEI